MAYTAFERTAGTSCINEVRTLERHLTSEGAFDASTIPTLSQVEEFITDTYYEMGIYLAGAGYNPTQTDADVLGVLQHYNALGACAKVELSQPSVGFKAGENTRYDRFYKEFIKVKDLIDSNAFERIGATKTWQLGDGLSAGGISISDKETIEDDSDHEPYFFTRDKFRHSGTIIGEDDAE